MGAHAPVVVVTGASAGVGRATVRALAARGARLGLIARGRQRLEETRREVESLGGTALALPVDVASAVEVEAAASEIERVLGPIDVWINNAMASVFSPALQLTSDELRRVTDVTYLGAVHGTLAALRRMKPRDAGRIVQIGSALAYRSIPLQSAYCAAKHALVGFTDSLRAELIHDHSRVHLVVVNLPALNTPQFEWVKSRLPHRAQPVPPIFEPEVAARAIVWAALHPRARSRREVSVGWPTAKALLAQKLIPGLADRYLARTAYGGQQTSEPEDPARPHNLWRPVIGPFAAHGRFGDQAHGRSRFLWLQLHHALAAAGAAAAVLAGGWWAVARARR
jgi:NAD(P)-dependent dehydrogenase (short-subunit alcohol dehydrogenase family)